jgi:hypothetical protein
VVGAVREGAGGGGALHGAGDGDAREWMSGIVAAVPAWWRREMVGGMGYDRGASVDGRWCGCRGVRFVGTA